MRAITLWQPWSSLVAVGVKWVETRSWSTHYRGPLAIHAAKRAVPIWPIYSAGLAEGLVTAGLARHRLTMPNGPVSVTWVSPLPLGAVVATCDLIDVVPMYEMGEQSNLRRLELADSGYLWLSEPDPAENGEEATREVTDQRPYGDFAPGRFAWILDGIEPLIDPIPATGHQTLWEWEEPVRAVS